MAITLVINGVSQSVESGAGVTASPSDRIQILVNGIVIDPTTITRDVNPPDVTLTLPDGQSVTLEGFVDLLGQANGGLLGAGDEVVVASSPEALAAPAAGGDDGGPDTAGDNNASTFNQSDPGDLGGDFEGSGGDTGGIEIGDGGPPDGDGPDQDPNELLTVLVDAPPGGTTPTTPTATSTTPPPTDGTAAAAPPPNVAPVAVADGSAVTEDSPANPVSGNVLTNDSDGDGPAALSVSQVNGLGSNVGVPLAGTFGTLTLGTDGAYSYILSNALPSVQALAQGATVQDVFTYQAFDGLVGTTSALTITITGTNDAPVTVVDAGTVTEDAVPNTATGNVLGNDSDVDGPAALTVSQVNGLPGNVGVLVGGTFGGVTIGADGTFTYTLDNTLPVVQALAAGQQVQEAFTYQAFDSLIATASTLTITITGANDAPDAVDDSVATDPDLAFGEDDGARAITADILGNDSDPDTGDTLTVSAIDTTGTTGLATLVSGVVSYDPNGAFESLAQGASAVDSFTYTISDGNGGTDTATVAITINGANDPPDAVDDSVATDADLAFGEDDGVRAITADILGNDSDPDTGDTFTVTAIDTTGTTGLATLIGGVVSYNPNGAFNALAVGASLLDTFTYTISDGNGGTDTATVAITITGANDPPDAVDDSVATDPDLAFGEDDGVRAITADILGNDTDPDTGDTLTVSAIDTTGTTGLATLVGGVVSYNPNGAFESLAVGASALDTFTYTVSDGNGGTDTATTTITVNGANDAPDAVDDSVATDADLAFGEDDGVRAITADILGNDTDPDTGDTLTVSAIDTTGTTGLATLVGGVVSYNPNGAFESLAQGALVLDTFTYTISDGNGGTDTAIVSITVNGANDAPDAVDDSVATDADLAFGEDDGARAITADILGNDSDPDAGAILTVTAIDTTGTTGLATLVGGVVSYNPNGAFNALAVGTSVTDSFTYTVSDGVGGTDTATATITVNGANDAPDAVDDSVATDADLAFGEDDGARAITADILGNDTDPDAGAVLTVSAIDTTGTTGLVTLVGGVVSYNPNGAFNALAAGASLLDTFTYTVSDGIGGNDTATVAITVNGANDAPDAVDDSVATDADLAFGEDDGARAITADLLGNDNDPDTGDTLTVSAIDTTGTTGLATLVGGVVSYNPNGAFNALAVGTSATDSFTYTISDGNGGTDTATTTITINGVNDPPDAVDDDGILFLTDEEMAFTTASVLANDSDPDTGGTFSLTGVDTTGTTGIVTNNGDGTFGYDPLLFFQSLAQGTNATDTFTYTITDDQGATDTATVSVTILGVNDAPIAVNDTGTGFTTDESTAFTTGSVLTNDTDVDAGTTLTVSGFDTTGTMGQVTNNGDGTFAYDPNGQFDALNDGETATDSFTYTISDGAGGNNTATVTVTVNGVTGLPSNVFFIDNKVGGGPGDGTQDDPFRSIGEFNTANSTGAGLGADAIVYLRSGTYNETDGVNLNTDQTLIGQGQDLVVNGNTIETGSAGQTPTISTTGATANGINLASGNTIRGLDIGDTTGSGIADGGATVGALAISDVAIGGTGQAIDIDQGGTLAVTLDSITSNSSGSQGIDLQGVFGIFSVTGTTAISSATGTSINIVDIGAGSDIDFGTTNIVNRGATGIFIDNVADGGGTVDFGTVTDANGAASTGYGIRVEDSAGAITFGAANISNTRVGTAGTYDGTTERPTNDGDGDAVFLSNNTGSVTFNGGAIEDIADNAFDIRNSDNTVLNSVIIRDGSDGNSFSTANSALQWINSDNLSLINVNLSNIGDDTPVTTSGVNVSDDGLKAYEVGGNLIIQNSVFNTATGYVLQNATTGSENRAVELDNDLVRDLNVTVTGSSFTNWDFQGLNLRHIGGSLDAIIGGPNAADQNIFQNINGAAINTGPAQPSTGANTHGLLVQNNDFDNIGIGVEVFSARGTGVGTQATIQGNDIDNTISDAIRLVGFSSGTAGNAAIFRASVTGNTIDGVGTLAANSGGGNAFFVAAEDGADSDVTINNNSASGGAGGGNNAQLAITTQNQRGSDLDLIFTNNSFSNFPGASQGFGLGFFQNGAGAASSQTIRFGGNDWGGIAGGFGESIVFDSTGTSVMEVEGFTGTTSLDLHTFISTLDTNLAPHFGFMIFGNAPTNGSPTVVAPTLPPLTPLLAAGGEALPTGEIEQLNRSEVEPVFDAAVQRWLATDLTSGEAALLESADFSVVDLSDGVLAGAFGNRIAIDSEAAGWGWFVDPTPSEDSEFDRLSDQFDLVATSNEAATGIDLLTAVLHELGHVLGQSHEDVGLLADTLDIGIRLLPGGEHHADTANLELEDLLVSGSQEPSGQVSLATPTEFEAETTVSHADNLTLPILQQLPYETDIVA